MQGSSNSISSKSRGIRSLSPDVIEERFCLCGIRARMWTSWTDEYPGMIFFGCANWKDEENKCNFFAWYDPPMTERARDLLNVFKNKEVEIKAMSTKLASTKMKNSNLKKEVCILKEEIASLKTKLGANGWKDKMIIVLVVIVSGLLMYKNAKLTHQFMLP